jgi:hypothetical protein
LFHQEREIKEFEEKVTGAGRGGVDPLDPGRTEEWAEVNQYGCQYDL